MRFKTLVVLMSLLSGIVSIAYAEDGLTTIELLGRRVYRNGSDGSQTEISATLGASNDAVSATTFACANCHGLEGEGKQEGGLNVPAINSQHLVTNILSKTSQPRIYDDNLLIRIITKGISAQNKPLSAAMPRYNLTAKQAQALLAYLKRLGSTSDVDVGVIASEVQLATVLPLTGPQAATGKLLKATLDACIAEANSQGLIYGRKMSLTALDSGSTKEEILAVTKRLISETKPFALITGYFPEVSTDIYQLLQNEKLPVIAPLSFEPNANPSASPAFFYFLPSYADQSRALIDYWLAHLPNGKNLAPNDKNSAQAKLTIVYSDRASNLNVVAAIRAQLQYHALNAQAEIALAQLNSHRCHFLFRKCPRTNRIQFNDDKDR
jgi:Periplasmic binding protein/Cytochrome c